jgi:hypothetical protein
MAGWLGVARESNLPIPELPYQPARRRFGSAEFMWGYGGRVLLALDPGYGTSAIGADLGRRTAKRSAFDCRRGPAPRSAEPPQPSERLFTFWLYCVVGYQKNRKMVQRRYLGSSNKAIATIARSPPLAISVILCARLIMWYNEVILAGSPTSDIRAGWDQQTQA